MSVPAGGTSLHMCAVHERARAYLCALGRVLCPSVCACVHVDYHKPSAPMDID